MLQDDHAFELYHGGGSDPLKKRRVLIGSIWRIQQDDVERLPPLGPKANGRSGFSPQELTPPPPVVRLFLPGEGSPSLPRTFPPPILILSAPSRFSCRHYPAVASPNR